MVLVRWSNWNQTLPFQPSWWCLCLCYNLAYSVKDSIFFGSVIFEMVWHWTLEPWRCRSFYFFSPLTWYTADGGNGILYSNQWKVSGEAGDWVSALTYCSFHPQFKPFICFPYFMFSKRLTNLLQEGIKQKHIGIVYWIIVKPHMHNLYLGLKLGTHNFVLH